MTNRLTIAFINSIKPEPVPRRFTDGDGMYLEVQPSGAKYWRYKYRVLGKEKRFSLGVYPLVSLKDAREARTEARRSLQQGVDPSARRRALKDANKTAAANSFEVVAREWYATNKNRWLSTHATKVLRRLEVHFFPWIGKLPVGTITGKEILACLRRIEARQYNETAHRGLNVVARVIDYAFVTERRTLANPAPMLRSALSPAVVRGHPTIVDERGIGALLLKVESYRGKLVTKLALRLAPLVFLRPGELRQGEWSEIDTKNREWNIPARRMKMRVPHFVPLSTQALAVIEELRMVTGDGPLMFPSVRTNKRSMSDATINAALREMGYGQDEMTGHGFRSMASTVLNRRDFNPDAIERQLAHSPRDRVRAAYDRGDYRSQRVEMMQAWADLLDQFRDEAKGTLELREKPSIT